MPVLPKPSSKTDWTIGNPNFGTVTVEPTSGKKQTGWTPGEPPPNQIMNWIHYNDDQWIKYLESITDSLVGLSLEFDSIVGSTPGCTHANLAAALAAASSGWRILVTESQTVNATLNVTQADIEIVLKPAVSIVKGSAATGIIFHSAGGSIHGGKLSGFSAGGNIGLQFLVTATKCRVYDMRFSTNTTDIDDSAVASPVVQYGNYSS